MSQFWLRIAAPSEHKLVKHELKELNHSLVSAAVRLQYIATANMFLVVVFFSVSAVML